MNDELEKNLITKHPGIFKYALEEGSREPIRSDDFACDDGWYGLIDSLCSALEDWMDPKVCLPTIPPVHAGQVKEKMGGLRFYVDGGNSASAGLIDAAERMSYHICEVCGSTDEIESKADCGWIATLCKGCRSGGRRQVKTAEGCRKCEMLFELYEQTPKTNRDYWVMTELFVMLHGGDVCNENQEFERRTKMKYRKKPVVVEAFQMTKERRWDNSEWPNWLNEAWQREPGENSVWIDPDAPVAPGHDSAAELVCGTLEGVYRISWGDWIIRGIKDELYPCKPGIFEATYEVVDETKVVVSDKVSLLVTRNDAALLAAGQLDPKDGEFWERIGLIALRALARPTEESPFKEKKP